MRIQTNFLFLRRMGFREVDVLPPVPGVRIEAIREVAARHGMSPRDLTGPLRRKQVPIRDEAIWRLRQTRDASGKCPNSYPKLAMVFGLKNHSSIMAAERRHERRLLEAIAA